MASRTVGQLQRLTLSMEFFWERTQLLETSTKFKAVAVTSECLEGTPLPLMHSLLTGPRKWIPDRDKSNFKVIRLAGVCRLIEVVLLTLTIQKL
jgi:hypothetical protein